MKRIIDFFRRFRVYAVSHDPLLSNRSQPREPLFRHETLKRMRKEGCLVFGNLRFFCVVIYPVGTEFSEETGTSFLGTHTTTFPSGYVVTTRFVFFS